MACAGCSKEECSDIFHSLRERCPGDVPDGALKSLAENFAHDSLCDIGPSDIALCLSTQGEKFILVSSAVGQCKAETVLKNVLAEAKAKGVNLPFSMNAVAIFKNNGSLSCDEFYSIAETLRNLMNPPAFCMFAWYDDPSMGDELSLTLILAGIEARFQFGGEFNSGVSLL